jgi:hypothetical protein
MAQKVSALVEINPVGFNRDGALAKLASIWRGAAAA